MNDIARNKDAPVFISVSQAIKTAKERGIPCTHATMIVWVKKHDLGYQALGKHCRWNINKEKLEEFLTYGPKKS